MHYLFSSSSLETLKNISKTENTLYAFDFDGTLSKITSHIHDATLAPRTKQLLCELAHRAPVAIISGRSIKDLKARLPVLSKTKNSSKKNSDGASIYLIGNHGLEGLSKWNQKRVHAQAICQKWLQVLNQYSYDEGVVIEDKIYSLSLHFRETKNKKQAVLQLQNILKKLTPKPRIINGKYVYNIIPRNSPHKGTALLELQKITKTKQIFYIGDDGTDEDVFQLLSPACTTVRVGKNKTSQAQYYLKRQSEINKLLSSILHSL